MDTIELFHAFLQEHLKTLALFSQLCFGHVVLVLIFRHGFLFSTKILTLSDITHLPAGPKALVKAQEPRWRLFGRAKATPLPLSPSFKRNYWMVHRLGVCGTAGDERNQTAGWRT